MPLLLLSDVELWYGGIVMWLLVGGGGSGGGVATGEARSPGLLRGILISGFREVVMASSFRVELEEALANVRLSMERLEAVIREHLDLNARPLPKGMSMAGLEKEISAQVRKPNG